jgi:hypothetical protein
MHLLVKHNAQAEGSEPSSDCRSLPCMFQGDSITVTKLGTSFSATYEKRPDNAPRHYTRLARAGQDELNQEDWNPFCNVAGSLVDAIRAISKGGRHRTRVLGLTPPWLELSLDLGVTWQISALPAPRPSAEP